MTAEQADEAQGVRLADMTPAQLSGLEARALYEAMRDAQKALESGSPAGRYTWLDAPVSILKERADALPQAEARPSEGEAAERLRALRDRYGTVDGDVLRCARWAKVDIDDALHATGALLAENVRLAGEVERLRLAILGGEDVPGIAMSLTEGHVLRALADNYRLPRERAEAAESKLSVLVEDVTDGFLTTESVGNPDPTKRQASVSLTWFGEGALARMHGAHEALARLQTQSGGGA